MIQDDLNRASGEDTTHDRVCRAFVDSGFGKILIYMSGSLDHLDHRHTIIEILAYLLRQHDPQSLAQAKTNKEKYETERRMMEEAKQEQINAKLKLQQSSTRHSRFGGTFSLRTTGSKNNIVTKKLVQNSALVSVDRVKKRQKMAGKRKCQGQDIAKSHVCSTATRSSIQKFCDTFLEKVIAFVMYPPDEDN